LKLQYDDPLSKFAFKFNLRRYNEGCLFATVFDSDALADMVGRCSLTLSNSRRKRLELTG
jgi:hypothetical protein